MEIYMTKYFYSWKIMKKQNLFLLLEALTINRIQTTNRCLKEHFHHLTKNIKSKSDRQMDRASGKARRVLNRLTGTQYSSMACDLSCLP